MRTLWVRASCGESSNALFDVRDLVAGVDGAAFAHFELLDGAGDRGGDLVLHLHRLDDADESALLDGRSLLDRDLQDRALERRDQVTGDATGAARLALAALRGRRAVGCSSAAATAG